MKKTLSLACAALLSLSLVACGGQLDSTNANDQDTTTATTTQAADSSAYVGTWKLAAMNYDGATVTGDFSDFYGNEGGNTIVLEDGGTGTVTTGSTTIDLTWKTNDDGTLAISNEEDPEDTTAELKDDALVISSAEEKYTVTYTKDGKYADLPDIDFEGTAIDSADDLVGTWQFCAARNTDHGDYLAYGDNADALAAVTDFQSGELVFEDGGTGTMLGYDMTWSLNESGVMAVINDTNAALKVTATDDGIVCTSTVDGAAYAFRK